MPFFFDVQNDGSFDIIETYYEDTSARDGDDFAVPGGFDLNGLFRPDLRSQPKFKKVASVATARPDGEIIASQSYINAGKDENSISKGPQVSGINPASNLFKNSGFRQDSYEGTSPVGDDGEPLFDGWLGLLSNPASNLSPNAIEARSIKIPATELAGIVQWVRAEDVIDPSNKTISIEVILKGNGNGASAWQIRALAWTGAVDAAPADPVLDWGGSISLKTNVASLGSKNSPTDVGPSTDEVLITFEGIRPTISITNIGILLLCTSGDASDRHVTLVNARQNLGTSIASINPDFAEKERESIGNPCLGLGSAFPSDRGTIEDFEAALGTSGTGSMNNPAIIPVGAKKTVKRHFIPLVGTDTDTVDQTANGAAANMPIPQSGKFFRRISVVLVRVNLTGPSTGTSTISCVLPNGTIIAVSQMVGDGTNAVNMESVAIIPIHNYATADGAAQIRLIRNATATNSAITFMGYFID